MLTISSSAFILRGLQECEQFVQGRQSSRSGFPLGIVPRDFLNATLTLFTVAPRH